MEKEHYTGIFLEKIKEQLQDVCSCMMILDREPQNKSSIQEICYSLHLMKGMAGTMGYFRICQLTEDMEEIFSKAADERILITGRLLDLMKESTDVLKNYTKNIEETFLEGTYDYKALRQELKQAAEVSEVKMLPEKRVLRRQFTPKEEKTDFTETEEENSGDFVFVEQEDLKELCGPIRDLVMVKNRLELFYDSAESALQNRDFLEQMEYFKQALSKLQESAAKLRLVSLKEITRSFRKRIRLLAAAENKRIDLYMSGLDIRIDRIQADLIREILLCLLECTARYGMDTMEVRRRQGKPSKGSIYLNALLENDAVLIRLHDDGNGTDISRQTTEGCERNLEQMRLVIEDLGGELTTSFVPSKGSKYRIKVPFPGIILEAFGVEVHGEIYVLDMKYVQSVEDIPKADLLDEEGNRIPLIYIDKRLNIPSIEKETENKKAVIVKKGSSCAGLVIDAPAGYQEAVIRPLGSFIPKDPLFCGGVILKDGRPALILDINMWI